jgi:hypothetical protein
MEISPVKDYKLSPVLERLQKARQEKAASVRSACNCPRTSTVSSDNPCCCGDGMTFFGVKEG